LSFFKRATRWFERLRSERLHGLLPVIQPTSLQPFTDIHGITIVPQAELNSAALKYDRIDAEALKPACRLIRAELGIYTKSIVRATQLEKIVLGSNVRHKDKPVGGLCIAQRGIFYLAADKLQNWNGSRRAFHHELFHCLDYYDDAWKYYDPDWAALNEANFAYSDVHKNKQAVAIPRLGFVSNYAMTAVHEDKAELFAYLVVHHETVKKLAVHDPILKAKVQHMYKLAERACPDFDEVFWQARLKHSVPAERLLGEMPTSLKIWGELVSGKEMWFVVRLDRTNAKPVAFYSREQLMGALSKLGVAEFDEIQSLRAGKDVELKLKAAHSTLYELGLW
jgi:hypothetical protein